MTITAAPVEESRSPEPLSDTSTPSMGIVCMQIERLAGGDAGLRVEEADGADGLALGQRVSGRRANRPGAQDGDRRHQAVRIISGQPVPPKLREGVARRDLR